MPSREDKERSLNVPSDALRVLLTGFGPFGHYTENPSWLAVKPLQNAILQTKFALQSIAASKPAASAKYTGTTNTTTTRGTISPRPIHVTTLQIPVLYDAVLEDVPPLYSRPPVLPDYAPSDCLPPPLDGFDFVFHTGVAGCGPLRIECLGHKLGYYKEDVSKKYAPVVDFSRREQGDSNGPVGLNHACPTRGFGIGYETSQDEYATDIDVARLVSDIKKEGIKIYPSMDAGHYLCDFTYYCSLAETKRNIRPEEKRRTPQVLFLHCPPPGQPLSTEEVTNAIKEIIIWVCEEIVIQSMRDEAAATMGRNPANEMRTPNDILSEPGGPVERAAHRATFSCELLIRSLNRFRNLFQIATIEPPLTSKPLPIIDITRP